QLCRRCLDCRRRPQAVSFPDRAQRARKGTPEILATVNCRWLLLCALGVACGAETTTPACPAAAATVPLAVGATNGELTLGLDVSVRASAGNFVESVDISGAVGRVQIAGAFLPAVVYERVPWPAIGANLYQALAVSDDQWWVLWFYCKGGAL